MWLKSLKEFGLDTDKDSWLLYWPAALWSLLSNLAHSEFVAKAKQNLADLSDVVATLVKSNYFTLRSDLEELGHDAAVGAKLAEAAAHDFNHGAQDWLKNAWMTSLLFDVLDKTPRARSVFLATLNDEEVS